MTETSILSPQHEQAIGALVVGVSKLDSILTDLIAVFSDMPILAAMVTVHHQKFANKVDCLKALMNLAFQKKAEFKPIIDLLKAAKDVSDFRNTVVHAHRSVNDDGVPLAVRFSARGEFKRSRTPISAEEIQARVHEAAALAVELASLRDRLQERPGSHHLSEDEPSAS